MATAGYGTTDSVCRSTRGLRLVDAYKNQSEVVAVAQKFKDKGLSGSVGVIVCDLPEPTESPYYRLDPKRFPDVKAMAVQVKELTGGATLMSNIKPTGVDSTDCPACGAQVCSTNCCHLSRRRKKISDWMLWNHVRLAPTWRWHQWQT